MAFEVCKSSNLVIFNTEKFFKMKKSECKEALEIYKRFLTRVTKIGEFMKLAEVLIILLLHVLFLVSLVHNGAVF